MSMTKISVIVATYNRAEDVKDTIDCLIDQETKDEFDYEVIVADNNSKDNTKEAVETYTSRFPGRVIYLFEPKQGKSYALNSALKIARGEIIAFVDDDCLLDKTHLWNIKHVFQDFTPDVGYLGGKISPKWIGDRHPFWLDEIFAQPIKLEDGSFNWKKISIEGSLGVLDLGGEVFMLDHNQRDHSHLSFYGGNMAFRRDVLEKYGGFDIDKKLGEDTEICRRLFKIGIKGIYAPNVRVYHKITSDKGTKRYYYKWWFRAGLKKVLQNRSLQPFVFPFGIPKSGVKETLKMFYKSLQEKDRWEKMHLRSRGFFSLGQNLGQMRKLFRRKKSP